MENKIFSVLLKTEFNVLCRHTHTHATQNNPPLLVHSNQTIYKVIKTCDSEIITFMTSAY